MRIDFRDILRGAPDPLLDDPMLWEPGDVAPMRHGGMMPAPQAAPAAPQQPAPRAPSAGVRQPFRPNPDYYVPPVVGPSPSARAVVPIPQGQPQPEVGNGFTRVPPQGNLGPDWRPPPAGIVRAPPRPDSMRPPAPANVPASQWTRRGAPPPDRSDAELQAAWRRLTDPVSQPQPAPLITNRPGVGFQRVGPEGPRQRQPAPRITNEPGNGFQDVRTEPGFIREMRENPDQIFGSWRDAMRPSAAGAETTRVRPATPSTGALPENWPENDVGSVEPLTQELQRMRPTGNYEDEYRTIRDVRTRLGVPGNYEMTPERVRELSERNRAANNEAANPTEQQPRQPRRRNTGAPSTRRRTNRN